MEITETPVKIVPRGWLPRADEWAIDAKRRRFRRELLRLAGVWPQCNRIDDDAILRAYEVLKARREAAERNGA